MTRQGSWRRSGLLRYILSYVALVCFALVAASLIVETTLITHMRRQQVERFEQVCGQQVATFQTWMNEMRAMKELLESNPVMLTRFSQMGSFDYRGIVHELKKLASSHTYLESVQLYPSARERLTYVFSDAGTLVPRGTIEDRAYLVMPFALDVPDSGLLLCDQPPTLLSCLFTLRNGAVLRFCLRRESLERALLRSLPATCGLQLFDGEGRSLLRTAQAPPLTYQEAATGDARGKALFPINEGAYWALYTYNDTDLFGVVYNAQGRLTRYIALLFVTGIALALTLAYRQYRPLRQLVDTVRHQEPGAVQGDEWELLRNFMTGMIDEKQAVQLPVIEGQLQALAYHALPGEEHQTLLVRLQQWLGTPPEDLRVLFFSALPQRVEQAAVLRQAMSAPGPQRGVVLDNLFPEWIACVAFGRAQEDRYLLQRVYAVQQHCERAWAVSPTVAVSDPHGDLHGLRQAFAQARTAMESQLPGETGRILFYDEMVVEGQASRFHYPQELEQLLLRALEQGEEEAVGIAVHQIVERLFVGNQPLRVLRFQCAGLAHRLLCLLSALGVILPQAQAEQLSAPSIPARPDFLALLESVCREACRQIRLRQARREPDLIRQVQAYIDAHLCDSQLSLESIAGALSVSVSHLSKQYKLATDSSLMHDVQLRRQSWFKEQLRQTDIPIRRLIEACGNANPSSMIRKFRETEGLTPSAYRKLFRGP